MNRLIPLSSLSASGGKTGGFSMTQGASIDMASEFQNAGRNPADPFAHVGRGESVPPDIQRHFVRPNRQVLNLPDPTYKGFPVGCLLLFVLPQTAAQPIALKKAGGALPQLIVGDQQYQHSCTW